MTNMGIVAIGQYPDVRNIVCEKITRPENSLLWDLFQESRQFGGSGLLVSPGSPRVSLQPMYKDDIGNNRTVISALVQPG